MFVFQITILVVILVALVCFMSVAKIGSSTAKEQKKKFARTKTMFDLLQPTNDAEKIQKLFDNSFRIPGITLPSTGQLFKYKSGQSQLETKNQIYEKYGRQLENRMVEKYGTFDIALPTDVVRDWFNQPQEKKDEHTKEWLNNLCVKGSTALALEHGVAVTRESFKPLYLARWRDPLETGEAFPMEKLEKKEQKVEHREMR